MQVDFFSKKYRIFNEDLCIVKNDMFCVMDGATDLNYLNKEQTSSPASKLVSEINDFFNEKKISINNFESLLKEVLINNVNNEKATIGCSLVFIDNNYIYYWTIGDCSILVEYKNKKNKIIIKKKLPKLDSKVIKLARKIQQQYNIDFKTALKNNDVVNLLKKNRSKANKFNGYKIISNDEKFIKSLKIKFKKIKTSKVNRLILMSDGFYQCFELLNIFKSTQELLNSDLKIRNIIEKIFEVQNNDKQLDKYNRFKIHDDASAISIKL